jgi:hypothetical protein
MNAKQIADLLAAVTPADVMQAYEGEANTCYCGCAGQYYYNSKHVEAAGKDRGYPVLEEDVNDEMIEEILETVKDCFDAEDEDSYNVQEEAGKGFVTHFTAVVGGDSYTVYLCPKA